MDLGEITIGPLTSMADLIDFEESLWSDPPREWAFRGQASTYGTLVPSFQRIFNKKRSVGAAEIIHDDIDLARSVAAFLADPERRRQTGERGAQLVKENRGALARVLELIHPLIGRAA